MEEGKKKETKARAWDHAWVAADGSTGQCMHNGSMHGAAAAALRTDADEEDEAGEAHAGLYHSHGVACPAEAAVDGSEAACGIFGCVRPPRRRRRRTGAQAAWRGRSEQ